MQRLSTGALGIAGYPLAFGFDLMGEEITPIQQMIFTQMDGLRKDLQELSKELKGINDFMQYTKGENLKAQIISEGNRISVLESRLGQMERATTTDSGAKSAMRIGSQILAWLVATAIAVWALFKK